jgi:hypothetical protein
MQRRRNYKLLLLLIMAVLLTLVGRVQNDLNHARAQLGLTRVEPLENAPPLLAFTTKALGGFRGLIANALWIRATELQDQGKYFEMFQLSDWITKLQPHLPAVWVHQAWNMAYNISIKFNDPQERWPWVRRGIELLRDEGLKYNPKEPLIYRELAWFFQHKIGEYLDDMHNFYKEYWARDFSEVIGPKGPPNFDELLNPKTPEQKERARLLAEKFKMDAAFMKRVDEHYGPLEWRLPESHAIYWAAKGLDTTAGETLKQKDFVTLRRVIFQSLQLSFKRGKLLHMGENGDFLYGPNLNVIRIADIVYQQQADLEPEMKSNILNAHKNFLGMAVYFLYTHNRREAAAEWYKHMLEKYPDAVQPPKNLDDYALSRIGEDVGETDHNRVKAIILGTFEIAFLNFAVGEEDVAQNHLSFAQRVHTRYQEATSSISDSQKIRVGLPPLKQLYDEALSRVLSPDYGLGNILEAQLRTRLGLSNEAYRDTGTNAPPASPTSPPLTNTPAGAPRASTP